MMRTAVDVPIGELVTHAGRMCLLDRAIEGDAESFMAEAVVRTDSLFHSEAGVGAWVGIEFMAQAVAAWAGWHARLRGEAPRTGFLLGTRRYQCTRRYFSAGECLRIEVRRQFQSDNGLGQFDCRIDVAEETVATAALNVFQPTLNDCLKETRND